MNQQVNHHCILRSRPFAAPARPRRSRRGLPQLGNADHIRATAAWSYEQPLAPYEALRDPLAFYPSAVRCTVDGEVVVAQEGDFYGGWITREIEGPFKGGPGTWGW